MMARSKTRSSSLEPLPFDLVIEILLKLPAKSIARLRCVSKLWNSTFRSSYFTESFFTISSSRTKLLFTCLKDGETFFYSSPHPHDQNPASSSPTAAKIHMSFPINYPSDVCRSVRGLVCGLNQRTSKGYTVTVPLICNPSTGESFALPRVKTRRKGVISYLGYDPIDKIFKVLCMTHRYVGPYSGFGQHQVLTLETGKKPFWKMIKCGVPHEPHYVEQTNGFALYDGICINGVLYYLAKLHDGSYWTYPDVVCFDIRSEEFSYVKNDEGMKLNSGGNLEPTLINYKGKLAKLQPNVFNYRTCTGVQLWVLEDVEKHQWLRYTYLLSPPWKNIFDGTKLCFVGTTATGEIVLSPNTIYDSFYLFYYNPERNTMIKVDIQGMEAFKRHKVHTFLDHVEDVKLVSSRIMGS